MYKRTIRNQFFLFLRSLFPIILLFSFSLLFFFTETQSKASFQHSESKNVIWEKQLNELNMLVIRLSAINLIKGLNLSVEQIEALEKLQKPVEDLNLLPVNNPADDLLPEITLCRNTYSELIRLLIAGDKISDEFKKQVFDTRLKHSLMIKQTLHGKPKVRKSPLNCLQCHALPADFPKTDAVLLKNRTVYAWQRKKIDKTHVLGMIGNEANLLVWYAKEKVDIILSNSQKCVTGSFTCCLLPPSDLSDPMRAGQAFSSDEWIAYLREVRRYDKPTWRKYKHLYLKPLEEVVIATLPSITEIQKQKTLYRIESIVNDVRRMDDITFELQKEVVCTRFQKCFNFDDITGVTSRNKNIKKYVTAMYLLFPGNNDVYTALKENQ